jgi:hypothetical protein
MLSLPFGGPTYIPRRTEKPHRRAENAGRAGSRLLGIGELEPTFEQRPAKRFARTHELVKTFFRGTWKTVLILYAVVNIAGVPDDLEDLRDYMLPLGAYGGKIVGGVVLLLVVLSLLPPEARRWLWVRTPWGHDALPEDESTDALPAPAPQPRMRLRSSTIDRRFGAVSDVVFATEGATDRFIQGTPEKTPRAARFITTWMDGKLNVLAEVIDRYDRP